jgi:hypothetical protein
MHRECFGGVQPSHRPKAGKYGRFSLMQTSQYRPRASQGVPAEDGPKVAVLKSDTGQTYVLPFGEHQFGTRENL